MGVFSVEIGLRNWQNRFLAANEQGEDVVCDAVVDTGASDLCLPADIVERLKLTQVGETRLLLADGEYHNYRVMGIIEAAVQGRICHLTAVEMPQGCPVLLGAFPLEAMDWHISPKEGKLIPNPMFPDVDGPVRLALRMRAAAG